MTLKRFEKISQYLHVSDCAKEPGQNEEGYDPLYKVKSIVTHLNKTFMDY